MAENGQLRGLVAELRAANVELVRANEALTVRVAELETRLSKDSQNSSKSPSSDAFVKPPPRSLRRASGRKPGKQAGEQGFRLEPCEDPDEVRVHVPGACAGCGAELADAPVIGEERRQVFDLPPIRVRVVEHRAQRRACGRCGTTTSAGFPVEASAPTCYGPGLAAVAVYLLARQHLAGSAGRGVPGRLLRRTGFDRLAGGPVA